MKTPRFLFLAAAPFLVLAFCGTASAAPDYDELAKSARATLAAMIETDTSNPPGNEGRIVQIVAKRLKDAGVPYEITEFEPGRRNIVARLKGTGPEKPLMLLAHIDVVGADGQAWTVPPHKLTEKDGFLYGRGTGDMLGMAAINLETFLDLKRSGAPLRRDVILAMTGDEESGGKGISYVLAHAPKSIDAGFVLNEGGKPTLGDDGKVRFVNLVGAEKIYEDFELVAKGKTGHSSVPLDDNAIYRLSEALARLGRFKFPARLLPVTRAYFAARASVETPEIAAAMRALAASAGELPADAVKTIDAEPLLMPALRTTCVATLLSAGTRVNALPAEAKANVNCRVLPDETLEQVRAVLARVLADPAVEIRPVSPFAQAGPSPVEGADIDAVRKIIGEMWPGVPVIPSMSYGASDSLFLRQAGIEAYGLSPIVNTDADGRRAHGIDERIPVSSLRTGVEFYGRLARELAVAR